MYFSSRIVLVYPNRVLRYRMIRILFCPKSQSRGSDRLTHWSPFNKLYTHGSQGSRYFPLIVCHENFLKLSLWLCNDNRKLFTNSIKRNATRVPTFLLSYIPSLLSREAKHYSHPPSLNGALLDLLCTFGSGILICKQSYYSI